MKLFKQLFPFSPLLLITVFSIPIRQPLPPAISTHKGTFIKQFVSFLDPHQQHITNFQYYDYRQEAEFDYSHAHVVIPTSTNPYTIAITLQNILKKANIERKGIKFIDLAVIHPYATLQNN